MSTMSETRRKRTRRSFTDEFKAGAVRLVLEEGKTVGAAARDLDLTESSLRNWVEQTRADRTKGKTGLTSVEREELARLRKENRVLLEERDILKKAAAFFAKQSRGGLSSSPRRRPSTRSVSSVAACGSRAAVSMRGSAVRNRHMPVTIVV
jgi:transposase